MFLKLSNRAAPAALLILSSLWMALIIIPFFYSLLFPNADIKHVVLALEGREILSGDLGRLVKQITGSVGHLRRAIQVTASSSVKYKLVEPRTTKTTQVSYVAWFEKKSKPLLFVVTRTEVDGSSVAIRTDEGNFGDLRLYVLPTLFMAFSLYWWLGQKRSFKATISATDNNATLGAPKG